MSVRLYPEIIVLSLVVNKIDNNIIINNEVSITIDECLSKQSKLNYSPSQNVFTCLEDSNQDWTKKDYIDYFNKVKIFYYYQNKDAYILPLEYVVGNMLLNKENRDEWLILLRNRLIIKGSYKYCDLNKFVYEQTKKYEVGGFHEQFRQLLRDNCRRLYVDEKGVIREKKKN